MKLMLLAAAFVILLITASFAVGYGTGSEHGCDCGKLDDLRVQGIQVENELLKQRFEQLMRECKK